MKTGYVATFIPLRYALMIVVEYVCESGHRIKVRSETIDWDTKGMVWQ